MAPLEVLNTALTGLVDELINTPLILLEFETFDPD
jgi:hypothetical protein